MRQYRQTVTFQAPIYDRTPTGQKVATYDNVEELTDLPANIIAVMESERGERMVITEELYQFIVQGDRPITTEMVALSSEGVFDVLRVANPTLGRPATLATIVWTERVAV